MDIHRAEAPEELISEQRTSEPGAGRHSGNFRFQRLSLDAAVAPLLSRPTAPFDRTERKRAHTSALYYTECFLKGIEPIVADTAAEDAQNQYDKWWIKTTVDGHKPISETTTAFHIAGKTPHSNRSGKRRKIESDTADASSSISGANVVSVASERDVGQDSAESHNDSFPLPLSVSHISTVTATKKQIERVKTRMISSLRATGGDVENTGFLNCLEILETYYRSKSWDGRGSSTPFSLEGNWLTLSKPTYVDCKGLSTKGEYQYSLGRMSFDMFKPTNLLCSMQATFNNMRSIDPRCPGRPLHVPRKLMKDIQHGDANLRTYDIVVALTIESGQNRKGEFLEIPGGDYVVPKPVRAILTNQGYAIPDPNVPNRLSVWFSGGSLEVQDEPRDVNEWKKIFDATSAPNRDIRETANILAAKVLLGALLPEGMEDDGTMSFSLKRPIGGHGSAYCDIIYLDETLRILRGHHGSLYVCTRVLEPDQIL